jgi:hypothetical protein
VVSRNPVAGLAAAGALVLGGCASGGGPAGGVLPPSDAVTLLDVQAQVFGPRCALSGCHAGTSPPFGLDLASVASSGANTVGVASAELPAFLRVEPFDPVDSYLYMKLVGDPRINGDPMPAAGGPLGAGELALVERWILDGAM